MPTLTQAISVVAVVLVACAMLSLGGGTVNAQVAQTSQDNTILVDVGPSGDVQVVVTETFNLTVPAQQSTFADLRNRSQLTESIFSTLHSHLSSKQDVTVSMYSTSISKSGNIGIVLYKAELNDSATIQGTTMTLQPFLNGLNTSRNVMVTAPPGYKVISVSPDPSNRTQRTVSWRSPSFTSFNVTFQLKSQTPTGTRTATSTPVTPFSDTLNSSNESQHPVLTNTGIFVLLGATFLIILSIAFVVKYRRNV